MISLNSVVDRINESPRAWVMATSTQSGRFRWGSPGFDWGHRFVHEPERRVRGAFIPGHYIPPTTFSGIEIPGRQVPGHYTYTTIPARCEFDYSSDFKAALAVFYEMKNGWIFPIEIILLKSGKVVMCVDVGRNHFREDEDAPYSMEPLDEVIEQEFKPWTVKKLKAFWEESVPGFDHNCKKRLFGFLQGALYRMVDNPRFKPNFLVKRRREVPRGDIDLIVDVIVQFIPVWEIFRSSREDYWRSWEIQL